MSEPKTEFQKLTQRMEQMEQWHSAVAEDAHDVIRMFQSVFQSAMYNLSAEDQRKAKESFRTMGLDPDKTCKYLRILIKKD